MKLVLRFAPQLIPDLFNSVIFFDYPLMVGFARKAVVPGVCRNTCFLQYAQTQSKISFFQPVKIKQSKKMKLWKCDAQ